MTHPVDIATQHRFLNGSWCGGVVGLGYVGLPLAVAIVNQGLACVAYDVSTERVKALRDGVSPVEDVSDDELQHALHNGLDVTDDADALGSAHAMFLCVPSPLGRNRQPDMSFIESAANTAARALGGGQRLVSLESTTYPGTTEELVLPIMERHGRRLDEDLYLAFSPERVDPGNERKTREIPKIVGGVSPASTSVAAAAYQRIVETVHPVSNARAAELTKLLENTYRAVNIALVNEMAQLAHELDIDIWEVIDAAATKPFGFQAFYPGPGVGGHCIPLDPQYLAWRARELRFATRFIDLADQVNARMPDYVVSRLLDELNARGYPAFGTSVLAVGIAYKRDVGDPRESPAIDVLRLLARRGARISVLDPLVPPEAIEELGFDPVRQPEVGRHVAAVVLTDHSSVDYELVAGSAEFVFDVRGVYRRLGRGRRTSIIDL